MCFKRVGVAGTFAQIHKGHDLLLNTAFKIGEEVIIALTADKMTAKKKFADKIPNYESRKEQLLEYLKEKKLQGKISIIKLEDKFGTAITDKKQDSIVVSEDTFNTAIEINNIRRKKKLNLLTIIVIPLIHSENNIPISSTRIRAGEIDRNGNKK